MNGSIATATAMVPPPRRRRYQKGQLISQHGSWHVRWHGWTTNKAGERVWQEQWSVLAPLKDYPKRNAAAAPEAVARRFHPWLIPAGELHTDP